MQEALEHINIEGFVAALRKDYSSLSARIRELTHSVTCDCKEVKLRLHFPSINNGKPAVWELINANSDYSTPFALPRKQIEELANEYGNFRGKNIG